MTVQQVAVLGLGQLGLPVAAALAAAGHAVLGVDPQVARRVAAAALGLQALEAAHAPQAGGWRGPVPWLITVLPDDATLMSALAGRPDAPGAAQLLAPGGVHLCVGTLGVAAAQAVAALHAAKAQHFVAAPVFGRPDEAWARDLTALFGPSPGLPPAQRSFALALLGCVAQRLHEVESPAAACAVKLAGNLMIASAIATMTEAFGLAQRHGAPATLVHEVISGKLFKGPVYEGVGRAVARAFGDPQPRATAPGFTLRLGLKDLALCHDAAMAVAVELPVGLAVQQRLQHAVERGHADRDWAELPACLA